MTHVLHINGLIRKIELVDFPITEGKYILSLNDQDLDVAEFDPDHGISFFDFSKPNNSNLLNIYIQIAVGQDEPKINHREHYLNFDRIDVAKIKVPEEVKLNDQHRLLLYGYFLNDGQWIGGVEEYILSNPTS